MTPQQQEKIKDFALSFYEKADQFHDRRHAELTTKYAYILAKDFPETNLEVLEAACWLHDIGRIYGDKDHAYKSAELAKPFLAKIQLTPQEQESILHAVSLHNIKDIHKATTIEVKLLYDADKMQQISIYGFLRACFYMIVLQKMDFLEAVEDRWTKAQEIWPSMQTEKAKKMLKSEMKKIEQLVKDFRNGEKASLPVS